VGAHTGRFKGSGGHRRRGLAAGQGSSGAWSEKGDAGHYRVKKGLGRREAKSRDKAASVPSGAMKKGKQKNANDMAYRFAEEVLFSQGKLKTCQPRPPRLCDLEHGDRISRPWRRIGGPGGRVPRRGR